MTTALFAQDQWTHGRMTLQGAVRYDRAWSWAPAAGNGTEGTSQFNPQPISFERTESVKGYNDITPRMGVAYDVFGNGKTALKANLGKYLQSAQVAGTYVANNPAQKIVTRVTARPWTDGNGNFQIDCNLSDPRLQDNLASGGDRCAASLEKRVFLEKLLARGEAGALAMLAMRRHTDDGARMLLTVHDELVFEVR